MPGMHQKSFLLGLAAAVFLFTALLAVAIYLAESHGVTVAVPAEEIGALVRAQVEREAATQLPGVVAQARSQVSGLVEEEMKGQLQGISIRIGEVVIPLPEEATRELNRRLQAMVQDTIYSVLDSLDTRSIGQTLGSKAEARVRDSLEETLGNRRFFYRPWPWLAVPVTIDVK